MANLGEPIKVWEIEPVEEPTRREVPQEEPAYEEEPVHVPTRREQY